MVNVTPRQQSSAIPRLSRLATERIAVSVEKNTLPSFNYQLTASCSNDIFEVLRRKKKLNHRTLQTMCTSTRFQINKIDLMGNKVEPEDLQLCSRHDLVSFRLGDIDYFPNTDKIQVAEVLDAALNSTSRKQLRHLDLSGKNRITSTWPTYVAKYLPSLESLAFANRNTANDTLAQIGASLCQLRFLDISNTCVTDISCISSLHNLEVLIMYNLNILKGDVTETLSNLTKLRVLDISQKVNTDYLQETSQDAHLDLALGIYNRSVEAIESGTATPWSELRAIDMSGLSIVQLGTDRALAFVQKIVEAHPKLEQISLLATPLDSTVVEVPGRKLQVINSVSQMSVLKSLSHYAKLDRPSSIIHIMDTLYLMLEEGNDSFSDELQKKFLSLVCSSMEHGLDSPDLQTAGSSCLFSLCKMERMESMSYEEVKSSSEALLNASEHFPSVSELQHNIWNTLCMENMLDLDGINCFWTCKLALDTMMLNYDSEIEWSTVTVVSRVMSQLMPIQIKELTSNNEYMTRLVKLFNDIMKENTRDGNENDNVIHMLPHTLTALGHFSEQSPEACRAFLEAEGVESAFRILKTLQLHDPMQSDVLCILNNLTKVDDLQSDILCKFKCLLSPPDGPFNEVNDNGQLAWIERSYYAAGILASLLTKTVDRWELDEARESASKALLDLMQKYPQFAEPLFSFSSFEPFTNIIKLSKSNGGIMWCLWGIHHVLQYRENVPTSNYIKMLADSELLSIIEDIAHGQSEHIPHLDTSLIHIARQIIDLVYARHNHNFSQ